MPLDDADRVQRLREDPRTDRMMGERMARFCDALQWRVVKVVSSLDDRAALVQVQSERGRAWTVRDGEVFADGGIERVADVGALRGEEGAHLAYDIAGLRIRLHLRPGPTVGFGLWHVACLDRPTDSWFGGGALLAGERAPEAAGPFLEAWRRVFDRLDVDGLAQFRGAAKERLIQQGGDPSSVCGLLFDPLRVDPEGAFFLLRSAGRAYPGILASLVARTERQAGRTGHREATSPSARRSASAREGLRVLSFLDPLASVRWGGET